MQSRSPNLAEFLSKLIIGGGCGLDSDTLRHGEALLKEEIDRLRLELDAEKHTDVGSTNAERPVVKTKR